MIVAATILVTVVSCMALGIFSGFLTISLILQLMSLRSKPQPVRASEPRAVAASGD